MGGPQGQSGQVKNSIPSRQYTDYATPAHITLYKKPKKKYHFKNIPVKLHIGITRLITKV